MPKESPSAPTPPMALAQQHMRLFALIVDYLLAVVLLKVAEQLTLPEGWDLTPRAQETGNPWFWVGGVFLVLVFRDLPWGRGLGKYIVGIVAARADNPARTPGVSALLIRNTTLILLPLEGLRVFTHPYFRRWGDQLAGTVVVEPARVAPPLRRLLMLSIVFMASLLISFLLGRHNLFRSAAYRTAETAMMSDPAVLQAVGPSPRPGSDANIAWPLEPGQPATVTLSAEGGLGEAKIEVRLLRIEGDLGWRVQEVRQITPRPADLIQKAAPPATPAK